MNTAMSRRLDLGESASPTVDIRAFKNTMSQFATGVAIVTTRDETGAPVGITINSLTSLSLDPPLLLWNLGLKAYSLALFRRAGMFAVNFLPKDRWDLCEQFARPSVDKFKGVAWSPDAYGLPLLDGMLAHVSCSTWRRYPGGDHEIFIGRVLSLASHGGSPLVIHRGQPVMVTPPAET